MILRSAVIKKINKIQRKNYGSLLSRGGSEYVAKSDVDISTILILRVQLRKSNRTMHLFYFYWTGAFALYPSHNRAARTNQVLTMDQAVDSRTLACRLAYNTARCGGKAFKGKRLWPYIFWFLNTPPTCITWQSHGVGLAYKPDIFPVSPCCFALHIHVFCGPASSLEAAWEYRHSATLRGEVSDCGLYLSSDDSCIKLHIAMRLFVCVYFSLCFHKDIRFGLKCFNQGDCIFNFACYVLFIKFL